MDEWRNFIPAYVGRHILHVIITSAPAPMTSCLNQGCQGQRTQCCFTSPPHSSSYKLPHSPQNASQRPSNPATMQHCPSLASQGYCGRLMRAQLCSHKLLWSKIKTLDCAHLLTASYYSAEKLKILWENKSTGKKAGRDFFFYFIWFQSERSDHYIGKVNK